MSARSKALVNGDDVVLYYGTGRSGMGSMPGMVYFMKDSLVVPSSLRTAEPLKRIEVTIDAA